jgi:ABC-type multidrug transport system ATPase subunit
VLVKRYSGGMKRRLNIAAGLVSALRDAGTAVVYTSHYLEEVEALCDRLAITDGGAIITTGGVRELVAAHGSPDLLGSGTAFAALGIVRFRREQA